MFPQSERHFLICLGNHGCPFPGFHFILHSLFHSLHVVSPSVVLSLVSLLNTKFLLKRTILSICTLVPNIIIITIVIIINHHHHRHHHHHCHHCPRHHHGHRKVMFIVFCHIRDIRFYKPYTYYMNNGILLLILRGIKLSPF
uniref:Uncharacterized protein n=1 Tax=Rousettus aegyptiacus TaxID=9407 RepID=A0A7J8IM29_ROUAE|nr:hypothetical protein HJG63_010769 [Rousettus aegyptiacus]